MTNPAVPPTAAILTLGCKLNIADSEAMASSLRNAGWRVTDRLAAEAGAVIVNSCSVTQAADRKSRHLVGLSRRLAPGATLAFTGCMVETANATALNALGAGLVYRRMEQPALTARLSALLPPAPPPPTQEAGGLKTRAFVSAQEGCDDVCAFCIIPRTRGRERSKPVEQVVGEARARESEGAKELVLTGTQLGAYGRESGARSLDRLIEALLGGTGYPRIRISSVQPQDLSDRLIDLWSDPRLCRHLHLALQSGSETVLQRMRRRYTLREYAKAIDRLRSAIPGVAITTDVIAGFPAESDAEFEESYAFCEAIGFAALHVFPYSDRGGTVGEKLQPKVPESLKKVRVRRLIDLGETMQRRFRSVQLGKTVDVLWEKRAEDGAWEGLTDTYVRVRASAQRDLHNLITPACLIGLGQDGMEGEVP